MHIQSKAAHAYHLLLVKNLHTYDLKQHPLMGYHITCIKLHPKSSFLDGGLYGKDELVDTPKLSDNGLPYKQIPVDVGVIPRNPAHQHACLDQLITKPCVTTTFTDILAGIILYCKQNDIIYLLHHSEKRFTIMLIFYPKTASSYSILQNIDNFSHCPIDHSLLFKLSTFTARSFHQSLPWRSFPRLPQL